MSTTTITKHETKWVRAAVPGEIMMEVFNQNRIMVTCYCLTINSAKPLQEDQLDQALRHLYRKLPNLRMCMRPKGTDLWFCEMEQEAIDFKVLKDADLSAEYEAMTVHHYNSNNGPLWRARLLPAPPATPCPMPELQESFPHQYTLLMGFHHSITDGFSSMKACGFLVDILNDVVGGKAVDDEVQLAEFVTNEQTQVLVKQAEAKLAADPQKTSEMLAKFQEKMMETPLILKAFPVPEGSELRTLNITRDLDLETTKRFINKCKAERVSFHSGFCAVASAALIELMVEAGIEQESFELGTYHTINNRRYWKGDTSRAFGCHLGMIKTCANTPKDVTNTMWDYARACQMDFHEKLNDGTVFTQELIMQKAMMGMMTDMLSMFTNPPPSGDYYGTTNMGNLDSMLPGIGDFVQATRIIRTTSNHKLGNICSHVMHTFRGRFSYGIDYVTRFMTTETAQLYVDRIFTILHSLL